MILADTSAWIEFDRATGSAVDQRLTGLIRSGGPLAVTEPVLMEVLAGARTDRHESDLRRLLLRHQVLPADAAVDFEATARVYRRCRAVGVTPRGMVDCLIAVIAWRFEAVLLAQDVDLVRVAKVLGVALDDATPLPPSG